MRKFGINLVAILALLFGLVATVPVPPVLADCPDGTDSVLVGDFIVCDADPGPENSDAQLDGGLGDDTLIVTDTASVEAVDGDGADDGEGDDLEGAGDGGNDVIVVDGSVGGIYGDYVTGDGGDDTIIVNGEVDDDVVGDDADEGDGGNDTITVNGAVGGDVLGDTTAEGDGGDDLITINGYVDGDVVGDDVGGDGGGDAITINADFSGALIGDGAYGNGGNDTITVNGRYMGFLMGDSVSGNGGDDTITINGQAMTMLWADAANGDGGDDTIIINGELFNSYVYGDNVSDDGGSDVIVVNGTVSGELIGDGATHDGGDDSFLINGTVYGDVVGDNVDDDGGDDTIVINGTVYGDVVGDEAENCAGDDTIVVNGLVDGNIFADVAGSCGSGLTAPSGGGGDDTVQIGGGGVSYATVCQDIHVATASHQQGVVSGIIDGEGDYTVNNGNDTLVFDLVSGSEEEVANLAAYLAGLDPDGSVASVGGQSYNFQNFENIIVNHIAIDQGPARLYDDGVTLGFANAGGVVVCNGPSGLRAATIDFSLVQSGQLSFGTNGFTVNLSPVSNGSYAVHVFKDGVEQINDANGDGVADGLFVFGF